jgi:ABC-2 type transport system permease protein
MSLNRKPQSLLVQIVDVTLIELTNWRWTWRTMLLLGVITPLSSMIAAKLLLNQTRPDDLAFIYCGNVLLCLMFENQHKVGGHFVFMRFHGTLDYFGSLPIKKLTLIFSMALAFLVLSIPSVIVVVIGGAVLLGVRLDPHPLILLIIPLCAISLAGLGALVGAVARTTAEATSLGLLVTLVLSGVGAVIIPPDRLPKWLVMLGALNPATYASSALRQTLLGGPTTYRTDIPILIGFGIVSFWLAARTIEWQKD